MTKRNNYINDQNQVLTGEGWKQIERVQVGDSVLTHKNRFRTVVGVTATETHHAYELNSLLTGELFLRGDQPVFARKQMFPPDYTGDKSTLMYSDPWWVNVEHLDNTFYIGVPVNQEVALPDLLDERHIGLSDWLHETVFWWLVGKYIKNGKLLPVHLDRSSGCSPRPVLNVPVNRVYEVTAILNRLAIPYTLEEQAHFARIILTSERLSCFFETFSAGSDSFHIDHRIVHLPKSHLQAFVQGYLNDAHVDDRDGRFTLSHLSYSTAFALSHIVAKAYNVGYSLTNVTETAWKLSFYLHPRPALDDAFYMDGHLWCPAASIIKHPDKSSFQTVFVEEDKSYVTGAVAVHDSTSLI